MSTNEPTNNGSHETPVAPTPSGPTVLVADDMSIVREPIVASLRAAGYDAVCAADGREAVALIRARRPRLILLDLNMPELDGLEVIRAMNALPPEFHAQVILLTAESDRGRVVEASRLGVKDYMLKRSFSFQGLLERMTKYLPIAPAPKIPAAPASLAGAPADAANLAAPATTTTGSTPVKPLLARTDCLARAESALQARGMSGVVMQVVSMAASPRADLSQIAVLVGRDPMLSARIMQVANSAAYASTRGPVTSIADAVKHVGSATVRNTAAALGIFEAMPAGGAADGFDPIRCWQHSFAVAQLCERLITPVDSSAGGVAYLVGLCHDLADIFFHSQFAAEYAQVLHAHATTGAPLDQLERELMGLTRDRLLSTILQRIGLPESIRGPIEAFHESERAGRVPSDRLSRILRLADRYACGLLLAPGGSARVGPLTQAECRAATGAENPPRPDSAQFRNEILTLTGILARVAPRDEAALMRPLYDPVDARVWLARESTFSTFDPLAAALESMVRLDVRDRLPLAAQEWTDHRALVILAKSPANGNLTPAQLPKPLCLPPTGPVPTLWAVARADNTPPGTGAATPVTLPITLDELAEFCRPLAQATPVPRKVPA
jgi:HD-like signal output (HDOD) protein/CheY-like chemotaxis protein